MQLPLMQLPLMQLPMQPPPLMQLPMQPPPLMQPPRFRSLPRPLPPAGTRLGPNISQGR